jgi:hypothetical protein
MTERDEHGRPEAPIAADETATLLGILHCLAGMAFRAG